MVEKGFAATASFNALINGFCKLGKMMEAYRLFEDMVDKHVTPNHVSYTILIVSLCKEGLMNESEKLFLEMQKRNLTPTIRMGRGLKPDEVNYGMMADAYCKEGDWVKCLKLVDEVLVNGTIMNSIVVDALTINLFQKEEFSKLMKSLDEMGEQGFALSLATCSTLVRGFYRLGNVEKAARILESMLSFGWNFWFSPIPGSGENKSKCWPEKGGLSKLWWWKSFAFAMSTFLIVNQ
ncbi:hypothetical protein Pyn_28611 [Prunus yedoensis var. nudiflora]|uniref:Pentatricopeptide repeat-containing protein n=1 Tax=Prunus yedoensis var. nudiflora TaxID=2094558 RepID=A0A314ZE50_PRUYE|nr:hypothetical protein Pyn_28611 [Prunus yedoensis var. nudiflora]